MISRCIALLLALLVTGCCASGVGCGPPAAPGAGFASDGLGPAPAENTASSEYAPAARARPRAQRSSSSTTQSGDQWQQEQDLDQAADARLTRQLKICTNC